MLQPLHVSLDLDSTLVYAIQNEPFDMPFDFETACSPALSQSFRVKKRPGVDAFFAWLAKHGNGIEVSVFTASVAEYADMVVSNLDPQRLVIDRVLSRSSCSPSPIKGCLTKDLRNLGSDLRRTVLVDNDIQVFHRQPDNGIHVSDFLGGNEEDTELLRVCGVLESLLYVADVREVLRSQFSLQIQVREYLHAMIDAFPGHTEDPTKMQDTDDASLCRVWWLTLHTGVRSSVSWCRGVWSLKPVAEARWFFRCLSCRTRRQHVPLSEFCA
uniref:Mitochondrial import inner membrane translocase subunit TIM50 n=1 Tax=Noctiluca scintillans TaxID=2966 RepID=A0A7S1A4I8_NOCSC|mmetsp:Transcript_31515/g.84093  ORF Transcript_31515/g.84093 Transcript_31515/m.84093 type:complete len:270 (+) Transcript_31515:148-957(+)